MASERRGGGESIQRWLQPGVYRLVEVEGGRGECAKGELMLLGARATGIEGGGWT